MTSWAACRRSRSRGGGARQGRYAAGGALLIVADVLAALNDLAGASRARSATVAVTGSVGDRQQGGAAPGPGRAGRGRVFRLLQQSLGRAASLTDATEREVGVFEIGMITGGSRAHRSGAAPRSSRRGAGASGVLRHTRGHRGRKAKFFRIEPGGAAVLNADNAQFADSNARRLRPASNGSLRSASVPGRRRLIKVSLQADSTVQANILGHDVTYKLGAPGRHVVDSLGVRCCGNRRRSALAALAPPIAGRRPGGEDHAQPGRAVLLIDESYNANPTSMRAALAAGSGADERHGPAHCRARRHAGARAGRRRAAALSEAVVANAISCFAPGR